MALVQKSSFAVLSVFILVILSLHSSSRAMDVTNHADACDKYISSDRSMQLVKCEFGGYIHNKKPGNCSDIYYCYRGPGEYCVKDVHEMKCMEGLTCACNKCQNCNSSGCPDIEVCSQNMITSNDIVKKWLKRFAHNLLEYSA